MANELHIRLCLYNFGDDPSFDTYKIGLELKDEADVVEDMSDVAQGYNLQDTAETLRETSEAKEEVINDANVVVDQQ